MGLLDGGIQAVFGAAFSPLYLSETLTRNTLTHNGKGGGSSAGVPQPCRVQKDACTEAMREQEGYTAEDVRLLVLQASVTGGDIDTDCTVTYRGTTYEIASVTQDPAGSYWECRGTPV